MKDPAVLFYTSDFISGTLTMNDAQRGKYIILLCLQHQQGYLTEEDMLNICKTYDDKVFKKFIKNGDGNYYNERMKIESDRRKKYSKSRSDNRKNICKTYDKHMETETININIIEDKDNIIQFDVFWNTYHDITLLQKTDKESTLKYWNKLKEGEKQKAVDNIKLYYDSLNDKKYCKKARTYLSDKNFNDEFEMKSKLIYGNGPINLDNIK